MKIAYLVVKNIERGGGIEKYTYELGSRLVQRGHEVTVYSMKHYGPVEREINGMRILPVFSFKKASMQKLSASWSAAVDTFFHAGDYDIVHLHSVAAGAMGALLKLRKCNTVLQMHGVEWQRDRWGQSGSKVLSFLEQFSLPRCRAHTAVSQTQCDYFKDSYNCDMEYIPTATEIKTPQSAYELLKKGLKPKQYILFASRLVSEKGAHFLIEAFKTLKTDKQLIIAGDAAGSECYKADLIRKAAGDSRIHFLGHVEGRLLEELFSHAYLYVQPSTIEGLSIALLEAMSYGNCCLCSDIPENLEAIGECGYSFASEDTNDLAERLAFLLAHPGQVERVKQQAQDRVREKYSWDLVTDKIEDLYRRVIARKAPVLN